MTLKESRMIELLDFVEYKNDGNFYWTKQIGGRGLIGSIAGGIDFAGYRVICFKGNRIKAHRLAWYLHYSKLPEQIDHINGIKIDNRMANLRPVDNVINGHNRREHREGNLLGTSFRKDNKKWVAQFWNGNKKVYLGQFKTMKDAHKAYLKGVQL